MAPAATGAANRAYQVLDSDDLSGDTVAIRAFNTRVANDASLESVMLTVRDGLTLIRQIG